jgi:hypothetical protein
MSGYFTNSLTPPTGLGLLASPRGGFSFGRAACGSVAPRKMACRSAAGGSACSRRFKAINSRTEEGAARSLPLSNREEMGVTTLILKRAPIGSNQEDYALMPHFARIFFIAFASLAASCASERAQKEATEREEIGRQLTAAYYSCVRTSFASMRPTMVDRNMGIDQAFMVCRAEESKLQAFEKSLSENPNVSSAAIAGHRNTLKEELLRQ